jgi:hypothetical protein
VAQRGAIALLGRVTCGVKGRGMPIVALRSVSWEFWVCTVIHEVGRYYGTSGERIRELGW